MRHYLHVDLANKLLAMRLKREHYLSNELFDEYAWDMLLILYVSEAQSRQLSDQDLMRTAGKFDATGRRWIESLEEKGYIQLETMPSGGKQVSLTEQRCRAIDSFLSETYDLMYKPG